MREKSAGRRREQKEPSVSMRERFSESLQHLQRAGRIANLLTIFFLLFLIAALYTPWTGQGGAFLAHALLSSAGGAVIIPILFLLYVSVLTILRKDMSGLVKQGCGTFFIFMLASLLLGLNRLTGGEELTRFPYLAAGDAGIAISTAAYKTTGVLGTFITGLLFLYFAMLFFNIHIVSYLKLPNISLPSFSRTGKRGRGAAKKSETAELANTHDDEGYDDEEAIEEEEEYAPNIAACKASGDYFNYEEEQADAAQLRFGGGHPQEEELPQDGLAFEEEVDYNDPSTLADDDAPVLIQDPSFNLDGRAARRVKQGIFPPPIEIFGPEESHVDEMDEEKAAPLGEKIVKTLEQFSIESHLAEILIGPTVIQFRIQLAPGIKVSKVAALANDIALAMAVPSLRIEAPIPGKPYVGIEIPNPRRRGIPLRTVIEDDCFKKTKLSLPLPFGVAVNGDSVIVGLEELPHLLVAGTTGSGKSVFVNSCIVGLCSKRSPEELRMILVDPKRVEMAVYDKLPHLLTPPVTDPKKAVQALAWLIREMEKRYTTFAKIRVRNLEGYNEKVLPKDRLPHIVIVVDELADLMMTAAKEVEEYICRLAQMARATGIHLMLATQRPSVNIITGLIKANIPARVAFTLPSNADSRTIIDCAGAEKLLGKGDMLFLSTKHPKPVRIQSPWIDEAILGDWLRYLTNTFGEPEFIEIEAQGGENTGCGAGGVYDDDLLDEAVQTVMSTGIASASGLQRRLRVGFSRASRLIDMMEQIGIVGAADGARPREILVDEDGAQELLDDARNG